MRWKEIPKPWPVKMNSRLEESHGNKKDKINDAPDIEIYCWKVKEKIYRVTFICLFQIQDSTVNRRMKENKRNERKLKMKNKEFVKD